MKTRVIQRCAWLVAAALGLGLPAMGCSGDEGGEPQGQLGPLPGNIAQEVVERGPNPTAQTVNLTNAGNCPLSFTIATQTSDGAAWLSVGSGIGNTVQPGASKTLSVEFDVVGPPPLLPGTYTGTITITGTCETTGRAAAGSPAVIAVNLSVTPLWASIAVDQTEVTQDVVAPSNWVAMTNTAAPSGRYEHTAVWTGYEMLVWGGAPAPAPDGASFDPVTNRWTPLPSSGQPPSLRVGHTAVWTGSGMIVWGGRALGGAAEQSGGVYDATSQTWTATSLVDAPAARDRHTAVWTGTRMIVWGGDPLNAAATDTGGSYDPVANSWTQLSEANAPEPRLNHSAVWTGSRMIVWGGATAVLTTDPDPISFPSINTGGIYDPAQNTWTAISMEGAPSPRWWHTAVWTGRLMIVWGGRDRCTPTNTGARYDPETDTWSPTSTTGAPTARGGHTAVWTGAQMLIWGGNTEQQACGNGAVGDGAAYDPASDSWSPISSADAPVARDLHTAIWTGNEMLVWGGADTLSTLHDTGARYR